MNKLNTTHIGTLTIVISIVILTVLCASSCTTSQQVTKLKMVGHESYPCSFTN